MELDFDATFQGLQSVGIIYAILINKIKVDFLRRDVDELRDERKKHAKTT